MVEAEEPGPQETKGRKASRCRGPFEQIDQHEANDKPRKQEGKEVEDRGRGEEGRRADRKAGTR